ncbi:MAG: serine/threonine protein kinase [Elainella sp. C42_A2020_010]|nr:serine/threonine protein kinase [Elainella sp. C42_A2020_010]
MEIFCTRPSCSRPLNQFPDLDDPARLKTVPHKFCTACGMPLILDNRYLPLKLLGKGGFGAAFLARDRRTPGMRYCVVKQFQPAGNPTPEQLRVAQTLFEREAEVLEDLGIRHPQIPDLLAFFPLDVTSPGGGQSEQFFYIVQEFVDGEDMEAELARRGQFSEAEVLEILTEMLKILQFVHENHSIHRDIKPSNIMRRRDGMLFLLDFGAVKQVTAAAAASQPGRASTGIYSLGFAPPEQMRGDQVYPATDLYALAVTCITLLTGKQPNELHDTYSDSWNWRSYAQVSDRLEAVLNRMLLPTPSQRFQSAKDVLAALQPLQSASPPAQPAPTAPTPGKTALQSPSPSIPPASQPAQPAPQPVSQPIQPSRSVPKPAPPTAQSPPPIPASPRPTFTLWEVLSGAAFTGFEGGLLAIATASLLGTIGLSPLFWLILLAVVGSIVFAQTRRWIEKIDLVIVAGLTLLLVWFFPFNLLHQIVLVAPLNTLAQTLGLGPRLMVLLIAGFACLIAVAATATFRLVYNLLSRLL